MGMTDDISDSRCASSIRRRLTSSKESFVEIHLPTVSSPVLILHGHSSRNSAVRFPPPPTLFSDPEDHLLDRLPNQTKYDYPDNGREGYMILI
ncbi:hypothetical protein CPLU01_08620 [Colletotrichum plurivorum]|uniref:Uncharacterized protein n=1 Tax=Colletotrichum plurivorum TaxID=2175906 RepID=A0A8H6KBC1_9PEZI|nr:hypothetical protein CPLU01_08620 [Colletotrichum plurivorum]